MAVYRFAFAALIMATVCLTAPVDAAGHACTTTKPPFKSSICHSVANADGSEAALFLSKHFTRASALEQPSAAVAGVCSVEDTIFSGKSANPGAPFTDDCEALAAWLYGNPGVWSVSKADSLKHKWTAFASLNSCAFAAMSGDNFDAIVVASDDITGLIEGSLARHQIADRLDVLGRTICDAIAVDWRIARTDTLDLGN